MPKRSSIHLAWRAALFASIGLLCSTACALAQGIDGDKVIVPSAASQEKRRELTSGTAPEGPSLSVVLAYLGLMGGGAYFVIHRMRKGRVGGLRNRGRGGIELRGSHMLGNRQFLVVAEVEGKRMLLGVGPGFISHLSDLNSEPGPTCIDSAKDGRVNPPDNSGLAASFSHMLSRGISGEPSDSQRT